MDTSTDGPPGGAVVHPVKRPDINLTYICFGGPDLRAVFTTRSDNGQSGAMP